MTVNDQITTGTCYCYTSDSPPTASDSNYPMPCLWQTPDGHFYQLTDNTPGYAVWQQIPLTEDSHVVVSSSPINGKNVAATKIFTPSLGDFYTTGVIVSLSTVSVFISAPVITVGINSSSYDNILQSTSLELLDTASNYIYIPISLQSSIATSGTDIFVKVTTGASAATYTMVVKVVGFYG